uniref:transcriptional regulator ATRX homolog isoform X2 n=1 Tax=Pristiophorus japonicus TaxID=55135 RepID=UPI00398ECD31
MMDNMTSEHPITWLFRAGNESDMMLDQSKFTYDYFSTRKYGLIAAAIMAVIGLVIVFSRRLNCRLCKRVRRYDAAMLISSQSPEDSTKNINESEKSIQSPKDLKKETKTEPGMTVQPPEESPKNINESEKSVKSPEDSKEKSEPEMSGQPPEESPKNINELEKSVKSPEDSKEKSEPEMSGQPPEDSTKNINESETTVQPQEESKQMNVSSEPSALSPEELKKKISALIMSGTPKTFDNVSLFADDEQGSLAVFEVGSPYPLKSRSLAGSDIVNSNQSPLRSPAQAMFDNASLFEDERGQSPKESKKKTKKKSGKSGANDDVRVTDITDVSTA